MDGGCYAMGKFDALTHQIGKDVYYFSLSTPKHPFHAHDLPPYHIKDISYFNAYIDTNKKSLSFSRFLLGASFRVSRFYSQDIARQLIRTIQTNDIDLVVFESIYAGVYQSLIRTHSRVATVVRVHNIEHRIWESFALQQNSGLKQTAYQVENKRLKQFEQTCLEQADGCIFISAEDLQWAASHYNIKKNLFLPVQMDIHYEGHEPDFSSLKLGHIGAMDWLPNVEGIQTFINKYYPGIKRENPGITLHLAGKSMPNTMMDNPELDIKIYGQVPDSGKFMQALDVLIVPIESGSGIRIKVLEAMASGIPVIATSTGIKGIPAIDKESFLLADDANDWLNAIRYISQPENYTKLRNGGMNMIRKHYSTESLKKSLDVFLNELTHQV